MVNINEKEIYSAVESAVMTVPGVISFANYMAIRENDIQTDDITKAIETNESEKLSKYKVHIVLLYGVNIRDVVTEVQIRVKYELEKLSKFTKVYIVDVAVDDLVLGK